MDGDRHDSRVGRDALGARPVCRARCCAARPPVRCPLHLRFPTLDGRAAIAAISAAAPPRVSARHGDADGRCRQFSDRACDLRECPGMVARGCGVHQRRHRFLHSVVRLRTNVRSAVRLRDGADEEGNVMNPNQALWEKGDFTRIAASMRESGEAVIESLGIKPGLKVLDLGCGDGTTALPAARRGADVLGVDIARNLVQAGNTRAQTEGLTKCRFQHGDASDLNELTDKQFDLVVSIFGAMFAPKPFDVAKEMVRVTRPGGRVVMDNWIPNDQTLVAQVLQLSSAYSPPQPDGLASPMTWDREPCDRSIQCGGRSNWEDFDGQRYVHIQDANAAGSVRG